MPTMMAGNQDGIVKSVSVRLRGKYLAKSIDLSVRAGLVASLAHPGGNVTGLSLVMIDLCQHHDDPGQQALQFRGILFWLGQFVDVMRCVA